MIIIIITTIIIIIITTIIIICSSSSSSSSSIPSLSLVVFKQYRIFFKNLTVTGELCKKAEKEIVKIINDHNHYYHNNYNYTHNKVIVSFLNYTV